MQPSSGSRLSAAAWQSNAWPSETSSVLCTRCTPLSCVRSPPSVRGWLTRASEWSHVVVCMVVVPVVGVGLVSWVTAALTGGVVRGPRGTTYVHPSLRQATTSGGRGVLRLHTLQLMIQDVEFPVGC